MKFIIRWGINAAALGAAIAILPGLVYKGNWTGVVVLALIFGLVNALLRPLIKLLTCPLIILTLGLFTLVINTLLFYFTARIGNLANINLTISDPIWLNAFLGGLIVSIVSIFLSMILKDELKGRRHRDH
jgi:putative membrane protein